MPPKRQGTFLTFQSRFSDERVKSKVKDVTDEFADGALTRLRPVSYEYRDAPGATRHGFIAQEARKVLPGAVGPMPGAGGLLGVTYHDVIPLLVKKAQQSSKKLCAGDACLTVEELKALKAMARTAMRAKSTK